ncbi:MAG: hypothetical protein HY456_00150 [Parcubacteria group bacterium]|nr:hypothetical protein [Parcubacteria group bacterium]
MAKGIGRLFQIGIAKESTRGTAVTTPTFMIPFAELDIDEKKQLAIDEQSRGVIEDSVGQSIVKEWVEGSLKAPIGDKHFGLLLLALFGAVATTDNPDADPSVKDHAFSVQQGSQHQSLTIQLDDPIGAQDYTHALAVINSLEIAYEQGKFIEYVANILAKKGATATITPASVSENRFLPHNLTFKLAATQAGLGAAAAISIKSLNLRINQNVEADDVLGNKEPADFLNKQFTIEGSLEAIWQGEADFKTQFLAGTAKAMRLDLKNTGVTIGTSANPQLLIDFHSVIFTELGRPIRLNDIVRQRLAFKAHYNTTDSKMASLTLTNTQASY